MRFKHTTEGDCRVLHVNRSPIIISLTENLLSEIDNQRFRKLLLEIYMKAKQELDAIIILTRDYGIKLSEGRVYRLQKSMNLPKMSTIKPRFESNKSSEFSSANLLKHDFNLKTPNHVYLCAILDLYSGKFIAWKISNKIDEIRLSCLEYIEQFYNNYNPHFANTRLTPNQKKLEYFKN